MKGDRDEIGRLIDYEGEKQERGAISAREGERRVHGTGQDVATSIGHHIATG